MRDGLDNLAKARPGISRADYAHLTELFKNAELLLQVFRSFGELAHAANLLKNDFAGTGNPPALFQKALVAVEALAKDAELDRLNHAHAPKVARTAGGQPNVREEIATVANAYRRYAETRRRTEHRSARP